MRQRPSPNVSLGTHRTHLSHYPSLAAGLASVVVIVIVTSVIVFVNLLHITYQVLQVGHFRKIKHQYRISRSRSIWARLVEEGRLSHQAVLEALGSCPLHLALPSDLPVIRLMAALNIISGARATTTSMSIIVIAAVVAAVVAIIVVVILAFMVAYDPMLKTQFSTKRAVETSLSGLKTSMMPSCS